MVAWLFWLGFIYLIGTADGKEATEFAFRDGGLA